MNCYGDGTVYRGERSADSSTPTYTWHDLAHAKGVPSLVTNAMLAFEQKHVALVEKCAALEAANRDSQAWFDALKAEQALEALELHATQYPHMQKGYTVDAITALKEALK